MNFEIPEEWLPRLRRIAERKREQAYGAARLIFLTGLKRLERQFDADHDGPCTLSSDQKETVRRGLAESNQLLAEKLGATVAEIFRARNEILRDFITENWELMSDVEIAKALNQSVVTVGKFRLKLGFQRPKGVEGVMGVIDRHELERAVTKEGHTVVSFFESKAIDVTRQRMQQITDELKIRNKRQPCWYAAHYARVYRNPHLKNIDRAALINLFEKHYTAPAVATTLRIPQFSIRKLCEVFRVAIKKKYSKASVKCTHCKKRFLRSKYQIREGQKIFFCDRVCQGKHVGSKWRNGRRRRDRKTKTS